MTFGVDARPWLARCTGIDGGALDVVRLKGSTSSSLFIVQDIRRAQSRRFVLRVLDNREWLRAEPDLAAHEAAALEEARLARLRAPRLVAFAPEDVGFGAPVVLMTFVEGQIELRPSDFERWLASLAGQLAQIHGHPASGFGWRFRSWLRRETLAAPAWTTKPGAWEQAIGLARGGAPEARPVFIHRDYHPLNVLWEGGALSGVVDWINACRGPAGADVAHCRTNLAMMFGPDAADRFLALYRASNREFRYDPYWDVDSVLDMCLPEPSDYAPWQAFGLARIGPAVLRQRIDAYLALVTAGL